MGWKETVRMNPLEDIFVALQPKVPLNLPFIVGTSNRPPEPTMPQEVTINGVVTPLGTTQFWSIPSPGPGSAAAAGNGIPAGFVTPNFPFTTPWPYPLPLGSTTVNTPVDFGWEYVWHCHLLGHKENDMMRPVSVQVGP
jgi:FtsP/CotA-like multicopper oxidase with cupredoxin domain